MKSALEACAPFFDIKLLLALPEHKVALQGGSRPSQSDIWVLARAQGGLVSIAVEGKVDESFDKTVAEWLVTPTNEESVGKSKRLQFLRSELGLNEADLGLVRYQLLHRTVSALLEAKRFGACSAVMLVHSFSPTQAWFADYAAFAKLLGADPALNRVVPAGAHDDVDLYLGWVCGDALYLSK